MENSYNAIFDRLFLDQNKASEGGGFYVLNNLIKLGRGGGGVYFNNIIYFF